MLQTVLSLYDVLRTDLYSESDVPKNGFFSTNPADYITDDGFYF